MRRITALTAFALAATLACSKDLTAPSAPTSATVAEEGSAAVSGTAELARSSVAISAMSNPAFSVDPTCRATGVASARYTTSWWAPGYGLIAYTVALSGTAKDRCSHGYLSGNVYASNTAIEAHDPNGGLKVNVFYRLSGSSTWRVYPLANANYWVEFGGKSYYSLNHIDMLPTQRITHVKLVTQAVVGGQVTLPRRVVCSFLTVSCVSELGS